jgi:hypothetical protein
MRLTFNTVYIARNGEEFGPLTYDFDLGLWANRSHLWDDDGSYFIADMPERDLIAVKPTPPAFATSA